MGPRSALLVVVSCVLISSPCAAQGEVAPSSERGKGELETDPREVLLREARGRIAQGLGLHRGPPALSPGAMDEGLGRAHEVAWRVAPSAEGKEMPLAGGRAPVEKAEFILLPVTDEEARRDPELQRLRRVALTPHDPRARGFVFRAVGGAAGRVLGARVWLWPARARLRRFSQIHLVSIDQESARPRFVPLRLGEDEYDDEDDGGGGGGGVGGEVLTVEEQETDGEIRSEDARGDEDQEEEIEEETETRRGDARENWKDDREDEHGDDDKAISSPLVFHVPASRLSWLGARSFALRLRCRPACEGPEAPPVFVALSAVPKARARLGRGVHGNSAESLPARIQLLQVPPPGGSGTPHCHREATLISFEELGWAHWIVYPKNFTFYRCRGTCPTEEPPPAAPSSPPPPSSSAAAWWWRWRRGACCAPEPGALDSLRVRTTGDGGFSYRYESVGGLVVRACACL